MREVKETSKRPKRDLKETLGALGFTSMREVKETSKRPQRVRGSRVRVRVKGSRVNLTQ